MPAVQWFIRSTVRYGSAHIRNDKTGLRRGIPSLRGLAMSGGLQLSIAMKLSSNYTDLFLMLPYILTLLLLVFFSRKNHPPKSAGEPWDKSKR